MPVASEFEAHLSVSYSNMLVRIKWTQAPLMRVRCLKHRYIYARFSCRFGVSRFLCISVWYSNRILEAIVSWVNQSISVEWLWKTKNMAFYGRRCRLFLTECQFFRLDFLLIYKYCSCICLHAVVVWNLQDRPCRARQLSLLQARVSSFGFRMLDKTRRSCSLIYACY